MCKEYFLLYLYPMAATTENRITRTYSFTFNELGDKEKYHAYAKRKGTNLAHLLKMLLAADVATASTPPRP